MDYIRCTTKVVYQISKSISRWKISNYQNAFFSRFALFSPNLENAIKCRLTEKMTFLHLKLSECSLGQVSHVHRLDFQEKSLLL
jgi:hypothetical protein